nr:MAG: capsid protein [Cressdnaviricota sp.]
MAFKRKNYKRKFNRKYKRGRRGGKSLAAKVNKLYGMYQMTKPELKYVDVTVNQSINYSGGAITEFCTNVPQGATESTRNGSKIRLRGLHIRLTVTGNANAAYMSTSWRMLLCIGKGENTTLLTAANMFATLGTLNAPTSHYLWDQRSKFHVLRDIKGELSSGWLVSAATNTSGFPNEKYLNMYIPLKCITTYNAATTNIINHGLYLVFLSDVNANTPAVTGVCRLTYTDA